VAIHAYGLIIICVREPTDLAARPCSGTRRPVGSRASDSNLERPRACQVTTPKGASYDKLHFEVSFCQWRCNANISNRSTKICCIDFQASGCGMKVDRCTRATDARQSNCRFRTSNAMLRLCPWFSTKAGNIQGSSLELVDHPDIWILCKRSAHQHDKRVIVG
jgi:hypothetical protein